MPAPVAPAHPPRARPRQRASILIVTMLLASIISISLASYLRVSINSLKLADRSFYSTSALNLAELGLEEALYCLNQLDNVSTPASAWGGSVSGITWTIASDNSVRATLTPAAPGPGYTAVVKVYCTHYNPSGPPQSSSAAPSSLRSAAHP